MKEHDRTLLGNESLHYIAADQLCWLAGTSKIERGTCTAHRSTYPEADPSLTWDQPSIKGMSVHGCDFLSGSGARYFELFNPSLDGRVMGSACNKDSPAKNSFELELRETLERSAETSKEIVKAVDDIYGISLALRKGATPTIPESVSSIHYTIHTKFNETHAAVEWY